MDAAILRTLARIKKKDPAIYNAEHTIFEGATPTVMNHTLVLTLVRGAGAHHRSRSSDARAKTQG